MTIWLVVSPRNILMNFQTTCDWALCAVSATSCYRSSDM
jgi:hypothetical protein